MTQYIEFLNKKSVDGFKKKASAALIDVFVEQLNETCFAIHKHPEIKTQTRYDVCDLLDSIGVSSQEYTFI